ncbi:hypothetical protein LCE32_05890 [Streptomyces sp. 7G]|uniref:DUF6415 family natural product biosynthesis protein n=1 Tax=Streptomyces sp. 7G TaxID=2877241 RepID=UPI001CD7D59B|nr:DUF6415 family natural product biosynthesis protein [Streptomyces sp. 7G]MCA1269597.1 hypothetical protein [Streptomyces sp. 7G]
MSTGTAVAAHPLSCHIPERHVPPGTQELYEAVIAGLKTWTPVPVGEIVATLDRVLESPEPPLDRELVYIHWQLRSWYARLSTIATADARCPGSVLRLVESGREIGLDAIGDGTGALGTVRRLATALSALLDEVVHRHGLRVDDG